VLLAGAGVALVLLPVKSGERSCGGHAVELVFDDLPPGPLGDACHERAVQDVVFAGALIVVAAAGLAVSAAALRRGATATAG
jgi:hypothetical protein